MEADEGRLKVLMELSLDGKAQAHEDLLRQIAVILRPYFINRLRNQADDVNDLIQESLLAVHQKRESYIRGRPVLPWVYAIARHKLVDHYRNGSADRLHRPDEAIDACTEFESASTARLDIDKLLDELPPKQQLAIRQTKLEGLSIKAAAAVSGMSVADVKVSVHRGLKALMANFSPKKR